MLQSVIRSVSPPAFIEGGIQTTTATDTVIQTIPVPNDSAMVVTCYISGIKSDGSLAANGVVHASYKNDGGTVTEQNWETGAHFEFPAGWNFKIEISGTDIKPTVVSPAITINWTIKTLVNKAVV